MIGDDIVITVLESNDAWLRIGVEAPKELPIHRKEVWVAIQQENSDGDRN